MICLEVGHVCLVGARGLDLLEGLLILLHPAEGDYSGINDDEFRDSATLRGKFVFFRLLWRRTAVTSKAATYSADCNFLKQDNFCQNSKDHLGQKWSYRVYQIKHRV